MEYISTKRNNRICYIILAVVATVIFIMVIMGFAMGRDMEAVPVTDVSQNDGGRLLFSDKIGKIIALNVTMK